MDTKKLIAVAFAAVAVGAGAAAVDSIDFESLAQDSVVTNEGYASGNKWMCESDCISNRVVASIHGRTGTTGETGRPDDFASAADTQALQVLCSEPLYRTIEGYDSGATTVADVTAYTTNVTTYFDMLVKFTPSEVAPIPVATDKIVVWVNAESNLVVTAKKLQVSENQIVVDVDNFVTAYEADDNWHRVTVVAIPSIVTDETSKVPVFKVYVDGAVQSAASVAPFGAGVVDFYTNTYSWKLIDGAAEMIAANQLFPSMCLNDEYGYWDGADEFKATGFQGIGYVDEYVFTTVEPAFFSSATTEYAFTLIWTDANVSAVTYQIGEGSPVSTVLAKNLFTTNLTVGTVVTVAATPAAWYKVTGGTGTVEIVDAPVTNIIVTTEETDTSADGLNIKDADLANVPAASIKTWADNNGISLSDLQTGTGANTYDSYLLNMPIAEYEMKVVSIAPNATNATKWDVTVAVYAKNDLDQDVEMTIPETVNGTINVKSAATLDNWATATPVTTGFTVSTAAGRKVITVEPENLDANFFEVSVK